MNENVIYQPMTEKLEMPSDEKIRSVPVRDYREHAGIRKTRIILLVLLSIQLVFAFYQFFAYIAKAIRFGQLPEDYQHPAMKGMLTEKIIGAIAGIIFLIIYIFMVTRYVRMGILVLAWLGVIALVGMAILLIFSVIVIIGASTAVGSPGVGIVASSLVMLVYALGSLLTIFTTVFSFKMAKLLKEQENRGLGYWPTVNL